MNVEGAELEILKTIPFDNVKIDLFFNRLSNIRWRITRKIKHSQQIFLGPWNIQASGTNKCRCGVRVKGNVLAWNIGYSARFFTSREYL